MKYKGLDGIERIEKETVYNDGSKTIEVTETKSEPSTEPSNADCPPPSITHIVPDTTVETTDPPAANEEGRTL